MIFFRRDVTKLANDPGHMSIVFHIANISYKTLTAIINIIIIIFIPLVVKMPRVKN